MISVFKDLKSPQRRLIRTIYIALIIFLAGFAFFTHRQLQAMRNVPVALPNYWFYIVDTPVPGSLVQAHGTWVVSVGPAAPQPVQTTTIECNKARMVCMESTAVVSVEEKSYLESFPVLFEVDQWTEESLVTKPVAQQCAVRVLKVNLKARTAASEVSLLPNKSDCKEPERTYTLDSGHRARSAPATAGK